MPKMLKVTKSDKTVHVVELANKPFYQHLNNRVHGPADQWKLEEVEVTQEELQNGKFPFIDETFVTAKEAQSKVAGMQAEIDHLRRQLEIKASVGDGTNGALMDPASASRPFAAEAPLTSEAATTEQYNQQLKDEAGKADTNTADANGDGFVSATEVIAAIKAAGTVEQVNSLYNGDTRKTVIDAAIKRIEELSK